MKVLVVANDGGFRREMVSAVDVFGHGSVESDAGDRTAEMFRAERPEAVVVDCTAGVQVAARLVTEVSEQSIRPRPWILAVVTAETLEAALDAGVDDVHWRGSPLGARLALAARRWARPDRAELAASNRALQDEIRVRRAAEEALRRSEELYRSIYNTAPLAIVIWDRECRVQAWNHYAEMTFGWTAEEVLGRDFFDLIIPNGARSAVEGVVSALLRGEVPSRSVNQNTTKSGEIILCEWNNAPRYDRDGKVVGAISLALDITEQQRMEERLRLAEKLEAIGKLAGGIAHDFNNRLVGVLGSADLLAASLEDSELREVAQDIVRASSQSAELISQLLAFARRSPLRSEAVQMESVIREVIALLRRTIDKRIEILEELGAPKAIVRGDPVQLENMLLNLALNARDAMPEGGQLTFSCDLVTPEQLDGNGWPGGVPSGQYVRVAVGDTGEGVDPEVKERLFEPFFTTKTDGTGMGLAAVYGTVRSHQGYINVDSEPGRGSRFDVLLPLVDAAPPAPTPEAPESSAVRPARVLLIEDEELVAGVAAKMLRALGHSVVVKGDGESALQHYRENWSSIDLVILDLVMPKMSGQEVLQALRAVNPKAKVLLCSGYSRSEALFTSQESETLAFLQKPYRLETLAERIRDLV